MNVQQVWQAQATEAPRISLAYVRHRAGSLERRTRWRNALEYSVGVMAIALFIFSGAREVVAQKPIMVAAHGCFVLWALYYLYSWRRLASVQVVPAEAGVLDTLQYQRRQFERQRDARRGSWRWWGLPMLPGFALLMTSLVLEHDPVPWHVIGLVTGWTIVGSAIAAWYLEYEARRFQREIDALDSLAHGT
ncbi:MAG TPA: hypothetical protein VFO82_10870 [Steroidobacteraceae bacterium]|nr:hypothetical protein [Steroidobacteraceae bacterium]